MALFGGRIFGDVSRQVTDLAPTMAYLAKGSITLSVQERSTVAPVFQGAYTGGSQRATAPGAMLFAFRARLADCPVGVWNNVGESMEFVGYNAVGTLPIVDWWAFGRKTVRSEAWGAEAYLEDGRFDTRVAWSAAGRPMRVVASASDVLNPGALRAPVNGDYAICPFFPLGAVRSGSETSVSGEFAWLESRLMWPRVDANGFAAPAKNPVARRVNSSYPTGWREGDMRASMLLVDVSGL